MPGQYDESVSPMTVSPRSTSPTTMPASGEVHTTRQPSRLRSELSNDTVFDALEGTGLQTGVLQDGNEPSSEAYDYLNGGLPHDGQGPRVVAFANEEDNESSSPMTGVRKQLSSGLSTPPNGMFTKTTGTSTPPGRRSVQFARADAGVEQSSGIIDFETPGKDRRTPSLMSKLKALATTGGLPTHIRTQSGGVTTFEETLDEEGSDADADAEETADEAGINSGNRTRQKRRTRRSMRSGIQTAPTTPNTRAATFVESPTVSGGRSYNIMRRRNTMPDDIEEQRGGLSEAEGRDRLARESAWRRGSSWIRGQSYSGSAAHEGDSAAVIRRPLNFRRATGLGGASDGDVHTPKRPFLDTERATTFGATRWKMLKHGLKMLGQKKEEHKIDYLKSAELMAELRAGAPAALMLASMIQRDEHGNKRIPVLLEQLKLRITDSSSTKDDKSSERHLVFRIELEYGSGLNRMKWMISRSLKDFINLHVRYKLQGSSDKYIQLRDFDNRPKQPRFPKSAFPWLRGARGLGESEDDEADAVRIDETANEATHSESERVRKRKLPRPNFTHRRKSSAVLGDNASGSGAGMGAEIAQALAKSNEKKVYNERQRKKLEQYLQAMIRWLIFRADSNRLCKFLELSALGVRLAAEGSYHGKEGYMVIQTAKGIDFRRILTPQAVFARHSPKWFLVRHSYIVCVDSPENMHIYDVFLLDSKFLIQNKGKNFKGKIKDTGMKDLAIAAKTSATHPQQHHRLKLQNSERKFKLLAKNERQLRQFEESIQHMIDTSEWAKANRFDSFAPVRTNVYAQWLVDGRDYMWNVSRAINMAKDVIYIHDWWLSPQLYMRRPAAISQKWRLDRLLRKKAREGVKVFIIVYRNVEAAVPIDSEFTKFSMLDLHPNIFVQRSPNQFKKNQFFFAHHEKICIVDHTVAFVGGIDLCFGRWDTPQHSVCDDKPTGFEPSDEPKDADHCQLWPGKDYSNPRVQDFYKLNEPYAEMYDRSKTPRMPWHDVSMQVVGQPARDLTRHFVQRWNYVLRGRKPTRPTPFLLPPPDFLPADIEALGLGGTCEVQILRSASNWSLGLEETEHSIMNAYCKMIEESEHFVYMENQFFITSCETMGVKIINKIGDALVERAIRAYKNNEDWRCIILIPLMPGFQNTVDAQDGTSIRLIMQCQFRSISRGEGSIFARLRSEGMEPEDFISFYSLRTWGKIGPKKTLVTEQLYIHAKIIVVDDRVALIGSANINERSMLGVRDSECAAVVRDTDMLWSTMGGKPYLVGRFAHTLRMRLMREHLGLDVDDIMEEERRAELDREESEFETKMDGVYDDDDDDDETGEGYVSQAANIEQSRRQAESQEERVVTQDSFRSFNHDAVILEAGNPNLEPDKFKKVTSDKRVTGNANHAAEVDGEGNDHMKAAEQTGVVRGRDSVLVDGVREVLVTAIAPEGRGTLESPTTPHVRISSPSALHGNEDGPGNLGLPPPPLNPRRNTEQLGLVQLSQLPELPIIDDTDIGGPPVRKDTAGKPETGFNPLTADLPRAHVDKDCMRDPLNDTFFEDTWQRIADNNTKIFRRVFRVHPDNEVLTWHDYKEFDAYAMRFAVAQGASKGQAQEEQESKGKSGPPGAGLAKVPEKLAALANSSAPMGTVKEWAKDADIENKLRPDTTNGAPEQLDEKSALTNQVSNEVPSPVLPEGDVPFPSLELTAVDGLSQDQEKVTEKQDARRPTFSTSTPEKPGFNNLPNGANTGSKRRRRGTTKSRKGFQASDDLLSRKDAEELLDLVQGNLVVFPYDWLKNEEQGNNWLYQVDQVAPLQIYD